MNITPEFTDEDQQVLLTLIDSAVRARGLEVAGAALVLVRKIELARQAAQDRAEAEARPDA